MAVVAAVLTEAYSPPFTSLERVEGPPVSQVLPVPPLVWGYTRGFDIEYNISMLDAPFYLPQALTAEGTHMEPMEGQIWPRY